MSKNTNRRGLALGAMFSLVASLFVGATPASATTVSTDAFIVVPAGADSSTFATLLGDDFTLNVSRNSSVLSAADFQRLGKVKFSITTNRTAASTYSLTVLVTSGSGTAAVALGANDAPAGVNQSLSYVVNGAATAIAGGFVIPATASSAVASGQSPWPSTYSFVVTPNGVGSAEQLKLSMILSSPTMSTVSPSVDVTVTTFYDTNDNGVFDSGSEPSDVVTVSFRNYAGVTTGLSLRSPVDAGETWLTASATLSGINFDQLPANHKFAIRFTQWGSNGAVVAGTSYSPSAEQVVSINTGRSFSATVNIPAASTAATVSAQLVLVSTSDTIFASGTGWGTQRAVTLWPLTTVVVDGGAAVATAQTLHAVKGSNVTSAGFFRPNTVFTVRFTSSQVVSSEEIPVTFTFGQSGALSDTRTITIDGGTAKTTGTASAVTKNTNTAGVATITILTSGFAAGEFITVSAKVRGLAIATIQVTAQSPTYTVTPNSTLVATAPGGTVNLGYTVTDQWGENVNDGRLKLSWTAGYNGSATTSFVSVAGGAASATLTHAPSTFTSSGTVAATYQTFSTANNLWSDTTGTADVSVTLTTNTNSFRQGLLATYSASISYGADFTWSATINRAFVNVTGSTVVATGTGLIFKDVITGKTASGTITLQSNINANVQFQVTGRMAGEYTVTLTAGTSTTTTKVTIDDAAATAGKNIAFDLSSMTSGRAAIITGTLTDTNGNPVETSGDASIQLTVTGTGAAFVGSLATETTAAGKFSVALLSGAGDLGTVTITATYYPTAGALAADRVTKVHAVSVVAPAEPEVNAVIGSYNGRWAVRVENAKGSVVSVKAGNRWVKFSALNNNYLFSRKSVVGRTIAVSVWVDGELQNSQTITIK